MKHAGKTVVLLIASFTTNGLLGDCNNQDNVESGKQNR